MDPVGTRPMPQEEDCTGRDPASHQLMRMTDLHGQQQIAGLIAVVGEVRRAMFGKAGAIDRGSADGFLEGRGTGGGGEADGRHPHPQPGSNSMAEGASIDIAQTYKDEPPNLLRPDLYEWLQTAADEGKLTEHKPHKPAECAKPHVDQRRNPSSQARTIDELFHSLTNLVRVRGQQGPSTDSSATVFQVSGTGLVAKGVAQRNTEKTRPALGADDNRKAALPSVQQVRCRRQLPLAEGLLAGSSPEHPVAAPDRRRPASANRAIGLAATLARRPRLAGRAPVEDHRLIPRHQVTR